MNLMSLKSRCAWEPTIVTARSYVQNGLIAMWDGIENAGWGVHDASATAWVDLIGGNNATLPSSGIVWTDNSLSITTGRASLSNGYVQNDIRTIEIGIDTSMRDSIAAFVAGFTAGTRFVGFRSNGCVFFYSNGNNFKLYRPCDVSISYNLNAGRLWVNNIEQDLYTTGGSYGSSSHGFGNYNGSYQFVGKIKFVRLYKRVLTESEIAANYEVDRIRFGIGGAS